MLERKNSASKGPGAANTKKLVIMDTPEPAPKSGGCC